MRMSLKEVLSPNIKRFNREIQAHMKNIELTLQTLPYSKDSGEGECQTGLAFIFLSPA